MEAKYRADQAVEAMVEGALLITELKDMIDSVQAKNNSSSEIVLVARTPGDSLVKSLLTIHPDTKVDFIRWDLTLKKGENDSKTFLLNINFGEGQANTSGFIGGGQKTYFRGEIHRFKRL